MQPLHLLILALGTWRISSLLVREAGPLSVFRRMRERAGIRHGPDGEPEAWKPGGLSELLSCVWCMSVWVGLLVSLAYWLWPSWSVLALLPLALSAVAVIVDKVVG